MRLFMLSWEYPPNIVGGIARHVHDLVHAMADEDTEIHVITAKAGDLPAQESEGPHLTIHRVALEHVHPYDFQLHIAQLNFAIAAKAIELAQHAPPDLIHAHDWLTAFAGATLKHGLGLPLVATIHATEHGRNQGLWTDQQRYISNVEWWLCYEAWQVIVCSEFMREEVRRLFSVPEDKLHVIYNGVDAKRFRNVRVPASFRRSFAADEEKIVFFVGRMVHEKGVHLLVEAAPKVLRYLPNTKFVIAGGGCADPYKARAAELGLSDRFFFLGFIPDEMLLQLYHVADVAVFPSLYEPFGIVALEAMAAGVPVVVSDVGGFSSIVEHDVNGVKHYPGDPESLGWAILHVLMWPENSKKLVKRASLDVTQKYDWAVLARRTRGVYNQVLEKARRGG